MASKGLGQAGEQAVAGVADHRRLAVHDLAGPHHLAAVELADALVAEAHAEHRHAPAAELVDGGVGDAGVLRAAGAGRDEHRRRLEVDELVERRLVVPVDERVGPQLPQVLDEVVDERVVVVDDEDETHRTKTVPSAGR